MLRAQCGRPGHTVRQQRWHHRCSRALPALLAARWSHKATSSAASHPEEQQQQPDNTNAAQQLLPAHLRGFRANVGVCLVNKQGLVFAATRQNGTQAWQMPQGGIDPGETPLQAALRELREETSVSSVQLLAEAPADASDWLAYEFPADLRRRLGPGWAAYKGQAQRWFLLQFTGDDSEINLDTAHREFSSWRWMQLQELPAAVIEFKRDVYEAVAAAFGPTVEAVNGEQDRIKP